MDYLKEVKSGMSLKKVPPELLTREIYLEAVRNDGTALQFVPNELIIKFPVLSLEAVKNTNKAFMYVPDEIKTNITEQLSLIEEQESERALARKAAADDAGGKDPIELQELKSRGGLRKRKTRKKRKTRRR